MNVSMLRVEWPIVRIVVGLVPDVPYALFVGVFRISLPHRTSAASASRLSTREAADSQISESHTSLLAISSSRFAKSTSFFEMPPASCVVKSITTRS